MCSSGFESKKKKIKPPKLDKEGYTLAELRQGFLCVAFQRDEGKFRSSELKGTLEF